jgi:hypothetical protein
MSRYGTRLPKARIEINFIQERMKMLQTIWGVAEHGKIKLLENVPLVDGSKVLVTIVDPDDEQRFWAAVSSYSLSAIWDNPEDDIYAELLKD